jgi:hypothetical protein
VIHRRIVLAGTGAAGVAALVLALSVVLGSTTRHGDGQGPLASLNESGSESMAVDPTRTGATSWTYGIRLCVQSSDVPAVVEGVAPTATVGDGFRMVGLGLREFDPSADHAPIISVDGYPPPRRDVPDTPASVPGFVVRTPCALDPTSRYTELLVGLERIGAAGGGWRGLDVTYTADGRRYVLAIEHDLLICGPAIPEFCHGP